MLHRHMIGKAPRALSRHVSFKGCTQHTCIQVPLCLVSISNSLWSMILAGLSTSWTGWIPNQLLLLLISFHHFLVSRFRNSPETVPILLPTWWLIPVSKWVLTLVINGISGVSQLITGVITHLLSGMNQQVSSYPMIQWNHFCLFPQQTRIHAHP